jgi:hypothetical protein
MDCDYLLGRFRRSLRSKRFLLLLLLLLSSTIGIASNGICHNLHS